MLECERGINIFELTEIDRSELTRAELGEIVKIS